MRRAATLPLASAVLLGMVGLTGCGRTSSNPITLVAVVTTALPTAELNANYQGPLLAAGGTDRYSWSVTSGGALPAGLALDSATGVIVGQRFRLFHDLYRQLRADSFQRGSTGSM